MKKTLIWEVLESFSSKETKAFDRFLKSPYFNTREDLVRLNRIINQYIAKKKTPTKIELSQHIFSNPIYNDQKIRLLLSYLHKLVEKFLCIEKMSKGHFKQETLLTTTYRERRLEKNFTRTFKKTAQAVKKHSIRNSDYYFTRFQLEYQNYHFISEKGRSKELNLKKVEQFLDFSYISTKLRQACFTLSHQSVFKIQYDTVLFDHILELAQQEPYKSIPSIKLYYNFITLYQKGNTKTFEQFKIQLFQQSIHFKKEEFRDIFLLTLNFCIKKINETQGAFYKETLEMYKKGLELKLLFENDKLSRFTYNNIVAIALRVNDLPWMEDFIYTYKNYLEQPYQHSVFSLNMARLEFTKGHYSVAQGFLREADYDDLISNITAKFIQMKIYYELKEYDSLDSLIQSLRVFIRRKKSISYHYQLWRNLLYYTQKIRNVNPYNKKSILHLREKINAEKILPEKEWLLQKLEKV